MALNYRNAVNGNQNGISGNNVNQIAMVGPSVNGNYQEPVELQLEDSTHVQAPQRSRTPPQGPLRRRVPPQAPGSTNPRVPSSLTTNADTTVATIPQGNNGHSEQPQQMLGASNANKRQKPQKPSRRQRPPPPQKSQNPLLDPSDDARRGYETFINGYYDDNDGGNDGL